VDLGCAGLRRQPRQARAGQGTLRMMVRLYRTADHSASSVSAFSGRGAGPMQLGGVRERPESDRAASGA
jgi:hypothetical protein